MTLRHMTIFKEVCRHLSITKAAEQLNMAQPAVSLAIKELECYYQVQLFERMNRRLYLTQAGHSLLTYAQTITSQFEEAKIQMTQSVHSGLLRIGANVTFGSLRLPALLEEYQKKNPSIKVFSKIMNSQQTEALLLQNELDLAIVDNLSCSHQFHVEKILSESMVCVCNPTFCSTFLKNKPNRSLTLAELATLPLLVREAGSGTRSVVDQEFLQAGLVPSIQMESISFKALIQSAIHSLGIAILPEGYVTGECKKGILYQIPISDSNFLRNYFVIYHKQKYHTEAMSTFLSLLANLDLNDPHSM